MLQLLQDAGHATLNVVISSLVQAAALALLIGAIDLTLGRRLRASLRQALWLLVVFKLILPPSLELPTSAAYWIGRLALKPREIRAVSGLPPNLSATWEMVPAEPPPLAPLHNYGFRKATDPTSLLLVLWLAGSTALAVVIYRRQRRVQRLLRDASPATPELDSLLAQASLEAGLSTRPRLLLTQENHSPAVCGLLRPTLLLPQSLADAMRPEALRDVLLHELIHIRRRDLWVNALQVGVQVLWWWNPIAWIANARVRVLRELAVDEQVQHLRAPHDPTAYPAALLEVARHCSAQPMLALGFVGILESSSTLKQRVERLLTRPTPVRPQLGGSGWTAVLALALLVVPMGFSPRVRIVAAFNPAAPDAVSAPKQLQIECLPGGRFQLGDQAFDLGSLTEELKRRSSADSDLILSLRSAPDAPMAGVLDVVKAAQAVGITRINIQTNPAKPGNASPAGDLPVSEILDRIVASADRPLRYAVEDYAVVFRSATRPDAPSLFTRRFKVARRFLVTNLEQELGKPIGTNPPDAGTALRAYLAQQGLSFTNTQRDVAPPQDQPAIFYNDRTDLLFVRATEGDLQTLETVLARVSAAPQQIQLETKIHEVSTDALGRLELVSNSANIQTGTAGSRFSFVLRPADARRLMAQLDGMPGVTQTAAPKVTTLSARLVSLRIPSSNAAPGSEDLALDLLPALQAETGRLALTVIGFEPSGGRAAQQPNATPQSTQQVVKQVVHTHQLDGIPDQYTAVLISDGRKLPDGTHRRRILLITPTLIDPAGQPVNPEPK